MTSQRFLNDNVNVSDFKRSLKKALAFPIIALVVLSINFVLPTVQYISSLRKDREGMAVLKSGNAISYFGGNSELAVLMTIGMVLCGIIMAIRLFSFTFKKNSVNVYFSMGITRTSLFVNRICAAAIELFAASFLPFFIILLANGIAFGFNGHQFSLLLYYTFAMFISGLAGLSIGSFAAAVSGSFSETVITAIMSSVIVPGITSAYYLLKSNFLRGYVRGANDFLSKLGSLFSPFTFIGNYGEFTSYDADGIVSPICYLAGFISGREVPEGLRITGMMVMPIAVWVVISVAVCALGLWLFNKRKNENAHSIGKFSIPSALVGVCVFAYTGEVVLDIIAYNTFLSDRRMLSVFIFVVATFLAFLIGLLIYRRKIKGVLKMLPVYAGALAVSLIAIVFVFTDNFGTFNKLPDISKIEYVSMGYTDPLDAFYYMTSLTTPYDYDNPNKSTCKSSKKEDIELCAELWDKIKDDKRTGEGAVDYIDIVIKTKDGKFISRNFPIYSKEVAAEYYKKVFNSDYFDNILKLCLEGSETKPTESFISETNSYSIYDIYDEYRVYDGLNIYYYYGKDLIADNFSDYYRDFSDGVSPHNATPELIAALYEEISAMTYDEYYKNEEAPVGGIASYNYPLMRSTQKYSLNYNWIEFYDAEYRSDNTEYESTAVGEGVILVYPQMVKTLEALGSFEPMPQDSPVKEVIYTDKKLSFYDATAVLSTEYARRSEVFVASKNVDFSIYATEGNALRLFNDKQEGTYIDFLEIVYSSQDAKLIYETDSEKAAKIADAARPVYDAAGDDGRYIYVILENNRIYEKYLPEKELGVLK